MISHWVLVQLLISVCHGTNMKNRHLKDIDVSNYSVDNFSVANCSIIAIFGLDKQVRPCV